MQLLISRAARADLKAIARYSEREWGAPRAKSYISAIADRLTLLLSRPRLGAPRDDIAPGYRVLSVGRHLVFYKITGPKLVVIRVLHQRMDAKLHL